MSEYNWTAWGENNDGDTHEIETDGNNVRDYSVTEAGGDDLLAFIRAPKPWGRFDIQPDFDGRAYIYDENGDAFAVIESESNETCDDCDGEIDDGERYDGRCGNCADKEEDSE